MKNVKIEIQVTLLTICIAVVVIISGYLAWQSLSKIVDTIHKEARPDLKLLLIKDIASDLNEVENTVRLYSITGNATFIKPYKQQSATIQGKLSDLEAFAVPGSDEMQLIDSIKLLVNRKLLILDEIRSLHRTGPKTSESFSKLYSRIDTVIIQPDTIRFKKEEKKGFFKRLFSKRDTTTKPPVIIDKSKEKEIIKQEIAGIEKQISVQARQLQAKEKVLLERNIQVTELLGQYIYELETNEQKRLETKTLEVDLMAQKTYGRMASFTIAAVILLIIILILFFQNLKRNRTYQQVLKKAKAEAESLAKAKEMFVATVSHEMRTPVNAIYGLTGQMLQKTESTEMMADLNVVHKSAEHLIALVNDTLDFSKIESQKLKIEQIDFLPDEIINEVHTLHKDLAQKKGIELIIRNNTDNSLVLLGDPIRLKQILINLITNAIKFTNQGQIKLTVSCDKTSEQNYLMCFEVTDTGVGISKADQQLIFDEFVQLSTDLTQKQRGAGLGLSIVKKLVQLQNGKIVVDSTPGKGTRFSVQIPFAKGNPENITQKSADRLNIPEWFKNLHFLIVDDEEFNLYLIKNILNNWGVSYTEAHNGQEAVKLSGENSYDLILMDMRMPVMDGYLASKLIIQNQQAAKIIALTATTKPTDIEKIEQSGIHAYLQKPFAESALFSEIQKLITTKVAETKAGVYAEHSSFDLAELERMAGGDSAFFNEMLKIFIRSSEETLAKFHLNFQSSNLSEIIELAHKLAAPAKHLNATVLYNHLKKLENIPQNSQPESIKNLIDAIEKEIKHINTVLNQKLNAE
jgi:signal transduction histidine kinase/CheY-like chemotaxis protein/HPt (histidine-containing phosphotransfer) domain-containing protein